MSADQLIFRTKAEFVQASFDQVAKIVSDHAQPCLEALTPAISAEKCLFHLAAVASDWSYDSSKIEAYADLYKNSNSELIEAFGGDDL
ncbi:MULTISPECIES: hypothetical protein [unclassified Acinetobacter]|uniref:hypothetical protein n=1 Tax=unclassified Acinetobacter TaxID=196816 RepID=UPI001F4A2601|nr:MULTISPECIES: hypothetical protein [unclassified Acinetobacter]MCH7352239.1 hypothetical protein [Acinetobacter sp. NIPH 2023]MCH7352248.1 hypothetical protein [Acinetobacter sp. NIPH 2023]MCH7358206.1 hypothetical protein [Acinetobacter sp. NIPH 2024]MCH7358215.1 hypothetical protein [Acinetobacter sp. NIPH 2024]